MPIALIVCKESRTEAKRHYHLAFGTRKELEPSNPLFNVFHPGRIYFDFSIDELSFSWQPDNRSRKVRPAEAVEFISQHELNSIRKMKLDEVFFCGHETVEELVEFSRLDEVRVDFVSSESNCRQLILTKGLNENLFKDLVIRVDRRGRERYFEKFERTRRRYPDWKVPKVNFTLENEVKEVYYEQ